MDYVLAKALHIIGFVSWFAGLLYIVRLFIYHVEAADRPEAERNVLQEQFKIMERRLWYGITWPAAMITLVAGLWMLFLTGLYKVPWMHVKLTLLVFLFVYHFQCGRLRKQLLVGACNWSSGRLRMFNEVATVLLVLIVVLAVFKTPVSAAWAMFFSLLFGGGVMTALKITRGRDASP